MCKPPTEGWPLFTGLWGPHSLETVGYLPPRDAHSQEAAAMCALLPGSFLQPRRSNGTPHPNLVWSFSSWAWCPSKHILSRTPQAVHEKNVAFFFGAQKMQINNSLNLHRPKTDPGLGRPVLQLPPQGSWAGCACVWVLGVRGRLR